jgi:hypothetical protein
VIKVQGHAVLRKYVQKPTIASNLIVWVQGVTSTYPYREHIKYLLKANAVHQLAYTFIKMVVLVSVRVGLEVGYKLDHEIAH